MEIIAAAAAQAARDAEAQDDSGLDAEYSSAEEIEMEEADEEEPAAVDDGQPAEAAPPVWADSITLQQQVAWGWLRHQHARGHGLFAKHFR